VVRQPRQRPCSLRCKNSSMAAITVGLIATACAPMRLTEASLQAPCALCTGKQEKVRHSKETRFFALMSPMTRSHG
jgi:hypothetical protein